MKPEPGLSSQVEAAQTLPTVGKRRPPTSPQERARRQAWGKAQGAANRAAIQRARKD